MNCTRDLLLEESPNTKGPIGLFMLGIPRRRGNYPNQLSTKNNFLNQTKSRHSPELSESDRITFTAL